MLAPGYRLRPPAALEAEAVAELANRCTRHADGVDEWTTEELAGFWDEPGIDRERDCRVIVAADGALVGYLDGVSYPPHVELRAFGCVDPDHRGRGLGSVLVAVGERWANERLELAAAGERVVAIAGCSTNATDAASLLRDHGYTPARTFVRMRIALAASRAVEPVASLDLRPYVESRDARAVYDVVTEVFRDHWGRSEEPFDAWQQFHRARPAAYRDDALWLLAYDGDRLVAFALSERRTPDDPGCGHLTELGVVRSHRQRGIASWLLQRSFHELAARGATALQLSVDSESETGAFGLYERAGMQPVRSFQMYSKELRAGATPPPAS